jgi:hypothetical protein
MKGLINTKKNIKGLVHPQYGTELDCFTTRTWPIVQKKNPPPVLGMGIASWSSLTRSLFEKRRLRPIVLYHKHTVTTTVTTTTTSITI